MKNGYDRYLDFQFRMTGDFFTHLFQAISRADSNNTEKLRLAFPEEVDAYLTWAREGSEFLLEKCSPNSPLLKEIEEGTKAL